MREGYGHASYVPSVPEPWKISLCRLGQKITKEKNEAISDASFQSSQWDIKREKIVHFIGCSFFGAVIVWMLVHVKKEWENDSK